jgi:hypothetical protein
MHRGTGLIRKGNNEYQLASWRMSRLFISAIAVWIALSSLLPVRADNLSRSAAVKFDLVCARCHEGECSGRLAVSASPAAVRSHVWRYLPAATNGEVDELFAILKYEKMHCARRPLPVSAPVNGDWGTAALRQWQGPNGDSYFIPLGKLARGNHDLTLGFGKAAEGRLRVSNEKFDTLLEERLHRDKTFHLRLQVDVESNYYLHLDADAPLLEMAVRPAPVTASP